DRAARRRDAAPEAPRGRHPAREAPGALTGRAGREVPAADHQGGRAPPHGGAAAPGRPLTLAEPYRGGPEGKLRGRPPPPLNHAPDRWRRTGSESVTGRAWTRPG